MTSLGARYRTGPWVSISAPRRWLLVDLEPQHPSVQRLWGAISSGAVVEDVLDILIAAGVRATPSFMLLWLEETARGFVRGPGALEVSKAGSVVAHSAEGHLLWAEIEVDTDASEFVLRGPDTGAGLELPMGSGVTMAARVAVLMTSAADPDAAILPVPVAPSEPHLVQPPLGSEPPADESPAEVGSANKPDDSPSHQNVSPVAPADGSTAQPGPSYDHLFGATVRPVLVSEVLTEPVEQVVEPPSDSAGPSFGATAGWHTATPSARPDDSNSTPAGTETSTQASDAAPQPTVEQGPGGTPSKLIDGVPWLTGRSMGSGAALPAQVEESSPPSVHPAARPAAVANPSLHPSGKADSVEPPEPADAEQTVNRAALLASAGQAGSGPTVLAGRCRAGHLTPSHSATCRVCRASIPVQQPFEVARPVLGVLRLSTGDTVSLDRGVLIGRKPVAPVDGAERPHLVRVNSPEHDVSRQHAEIVLEGWQVYVRDLGSTNGTTVTLPGQSPQRLREGELQLLEHGTVIILADEMQCVFEVTP
jgi:hypothetical protein